jgi:hypothetical protein
MATPLRTPAREDIQHIREEHMKSNTFTISDLFSSNRRYIVPLSSARP